MTSFKTIFVLRVGAQLPTGAGAAVMEDVLISAMEEKHGFGFILKEQDGEYAFKSTLIVDAVGTGMAVETAKSFIKVELTDGGVVVKTESSYKLMPVPSVEAQDEVADTHEKITAQTNKMGGAANFKVKLD